MKQCPKPYSTLELTQWMPEAIIIPISQMRKKSPRGWIPHVYHCTALRTSLYWGATSGEGVRMAMEKWRWSWDKCTSLLDWGLEQPQRFMDMWERGCPLAVSSCGPPSGGYWEAREIHWGKGVLSDWNPALFSDSSITGESREGKGRKHKKLQHMSSICNVICVFWAKLLYMLWGELQINDETF